MDQIVQKIKAMALKEMDAILTKFGGAAANPQLKIIIDTKKDQFEMDYLNAQIAYLDKAGDKTMVATISKDRDALSKKIEGEFADFDTAKAVTYAVGDEVIYLLQDKKPEEYDKTKKPEDTTDPIQKIALVISEFNPQKGGQDKTKKLEDSLEEKCFTSKQLGIFLRKLL
jgi:hypothetical protein